MKQKRAEEHQGNSSNATGEEERDFSLGHGSPLSRAVQGLLQIGLGEFLLKAATNVLSLIGIVIVVWVAQLYFRRSEPRADSAARSQEETALPEHVSLASVSASSPTDGGILREADIHTNMPERSRQEIISYTVQPGDTVSGIAERFDLEEKTIFAANFDTLQDDPHMLRPGQELRILPVNGVYWEWLGGIPFSQWAGYFGVKPEDILNYPANRLDPAAIADPNNPNIQVGTFLIIPGGSYGYHTPGGIPLGSFTRNNPASAQVGGAGACPAVSGGAVGYGTFIYPTDRHQLSGFDYSIKGNHLGIDLTANLGDNVYASDGGVVVYAGANGYGYGNMIMIDHGTGFQTLYAHLSAIFTSCGFNVAQGEVIGAAGSTGRSSGAHLHFEVRTLSNVINPWDVLPPP